MTDTLTPAQASQLVPYLEAVCQDLTLQAAWWYAANRLFAGEPLTLEVTA